jgi:hypothetical protein
MPAQPGGRALTLRSGFVATARWPAIAEVTGRSLPIRNQSIINLHPTAPIWTVPAPLVGVAPEIGDAQIPRIAWTVGNSILLWLTKDQRRQH